MIIIFFNYTEGRRMVDDTKTCVHSGAGWQPLAGLFWPVGCRRSDMMELT
jgi:hypothetical protein